MIEGVILPGLLALIMFGVGLDMRPRTFLTHPMPMRSLIFGLVGVAFILPLGGLALAAIVDVDPVLRTGLMLLAISPVGLLASPLTGHAKGNVALALALTMIASLGYILFAPLVIGALPIPVDANGAMIRVPADLLFSKIVLVTLLPALSGTALNARFPAAGPHLSRLIARLTSPALAVVLGCIVFENRAALVEAPLQMLIAVLAIDTFAVLVALLLGRLGRLDGKDRAALFFAHLMRQEGTGIFIAVSILAVPAAAVPLITNTVIGLGLCGAAWLIRAFWAEKSSDDLARHQPS